ncbi:hypothetical protein VV01_16285 [Luteipulveratus halotolerans]|uniref:histidine kinase n=1 Tax=Luteipulveratus halotolerans TaxID=1631356 RepID=A0A0L6CKR5_9MICO|nr:hypothetical protein VV01_16285 [Luteipulveratus halotolerans]
MMLDLRLAALVLLCLDEAGRSGLSAYVLVCAAIPLSFVPLRRINRRGAAFMHRWWWAVLDSMVTSLVLVTFGLNSGALLYVGASVAFASFVSIRAGAVTIAPIIVTHIVGVVLDVLGPAELDLTAITARFTLLAGAAWMGRRLATVLTAHDTLRGEISQARELQARAEERNRLSTEMHDSVAKSLHGVAMLAETLHDGLAKEGHAQQQSAAILQRSVEIARGEARTLVGALRTPEAGELEASMRAAVARWEADHTAYTTALKTPETAVRLSPESTFELMRCVQECLENVARHVPGGHVAIECTAVDGWVEVSVTDEGPGLPEGIDIDGLVRRGHYGLAGLRDRMARIRGSVSFGPASHGGAVVRMRVPAAVDPQTAHQGQMIGPVA